VLPLATPLNRAASPLTAVANGAAGRAAVVTGPGTARTQSIPLREPGPGEVRVRLEGSGVCASSLPLWQGRDWFSYPCEPGAPGHEGWGVIDAVGDTVNDVQPGQRVAVLSYHAFATFDIAPAAHVVPLPAALDHQPVPGEPLGCAFNVFRRSAIEPGQDVAIVGIGFLGALLTRLAADAGARVIALSRRPFALEIARQFGAAETIALDDHGRALARVRSLTAGRGCMRVIEAVGEQWPLDLAGELAAERGRLVIAGFHQDGSRRVDLQLWNWRGLDVVNAHERDPAAYLRGMNEAVSAIEAGRLDPSPLYTHRYDLDQLGLALNHAIERPDGFLKGLVCP
jgi:threonine dehydrogenase-like Zn-dependent dehydrogenase